MMNINVLQIKDIETYRDLLTKESCGAPYII